MANRSQTSTVIIVICAIATGGLVLAVVGAVHHSWGVVCEGLAGAALLYGLTIRTALRQRR